ncbi:MAG TPA: chaperone modulator CbpM [Methylophilaceae bacterium]|nr:chaperone modulator CbpM [Methylophilaceae bacterium]
MIVDLTEVAWLDEQHQLSLDELAKLSGLSAEELAELVQNGALEPSGTQEMTFSSSCLVSVRTVARLRDDFELDINALSLLLVYLERIRQLEEQIRRLHNSSAAELRRCHL